MGIYIYISKNKAKMVLITVSLVLLQSSIIAQDILFGDEPKQARGELRSRSFDVGNSGISSDNRRNSGPNSFQRIFNGFSFTNSTRSIDFHPTVQNPTSNSHARSKESTINFSSVLSREECDESAEQACTTFDNKAGKCVLLDLCDSLRTLSRRHWDNRRIRRSKCGCHGGTREFVCCAESAYRGSHSAPLTVTGPSIQSKTSAPTRSTQRERLWQECGYTNAARKKIIGGTEAPVGAWPWMVAVGYGNANRRSFQCGGSLISKTHVLTAAHCVILSDTNFIDPQLKFVRLGDHNLNSTEDPVNPIDIEVEKVFVEPNYNSSDYQNDIAIIQLKRPVDFTMEIHPICLPNPYDSRFQNLNGDKAFVTGWGKTNSRSRYGSNVLNEVEVEILPISFCKARYINTPAKLDNSQLCAGSVRGEIDACKGDSGGPLMIPDENVFDNFGLQRHTVVGIVSFGIGCGNPNFPGIYTRVTSFMDWIHNTISNFPLSTTSTNRPRPHLSLPSQADSITPPKSPLPLCGKTSVNRKIISGSEAPIGAWPWIVSLYGDKFGGSDLFLCGTLVSEAHVLTAAHCVFAAFVNIKYVRLSERSLNSKGDPDKTIEVERIFLEPNYNLSNYQNDIAIVKLKKPVPFTIHPICLPKSDNFRHFNGEDEELIVTGWGQTYKNQLDAVLRDVKVEAVPRTTCQKVFTDKYVPPEIVNSQLCAKSLNREIGICFGYDGSPIIVQEKGVESYTLVGILSLGIDCGDSTTPALYTRVTRFINWIHNIIGNRRAQ